VKANTVWGTIWRITAAGAALGGVCGALYVLIQSSIGMARHPDAGAIPAVLVLTYFGVIAGGFSGVALGLGNGILTAVVALPITRLMRTGTDTGQIALLGIVATVAGIFNFLAIRAVLAWWLAGGTISFVQFPLAFGWASAVVADLWITRWIYQRRRTEKR
jgi:hypothetical protein